MAYDEHLAGRVRAVVCVREGIGERKIFGGLASSPRLAHGVLAGRVDADHAAPLPVR